MHITLTPAQHARLAKSQKGRGLPQNFDPAQWADHPLNVPIYVTKGKGQYEGHGGGWTDLVSTLYGYIPDSVKKAVKSEVKKVARTGFGKAADHAASFAKKHGVSDTMVDMARSEAGKRVNSKIDSLVGDGYGMHHGSGLRAVGSGRKRVGGEGTQGVRLRGSGLRAVGADMHGNGKRRIRVTE
jgi:hypothetical protein